MGGAWLLRGDALPAIPQAEGETRMDVRTYLCQVARRISDNTLSDFTDAEAHRRLLPEKRQQFMDMMGLQHFPPLQERMPPKVTVTGVLEREGYRIEKLYYEALPSFYLTANLYVPDGLTEPAPGVLYVCGHGQHQKWHYQGHPRRFAQLGFVCLIVETVQLGEVAGYHHGCYREGWWQWYSRGYTPAGIELLGGSRGLDLLQARPEVDGTRLGVTGISGGGASSWWIAAGDERIKVSAPCCGTATLASHIIDRTIDGHCDCMWWINSRQWDLPDVGALIAPRPLLIASADRDAIFTIESIREVHARLAKLYGMLGVPQNLKLVETPGPHSYHERSRTAIFSWFLKHLQGKDVSPEEVGDIEGAPDGPETVEALQVYVNGPPADNRLPRIQDEWIPLAGAPEIAKAEDVAHARDGLVAALREHTFGAWPKMPCDLDPRVEFQFANGDTRGYRFTYAPEESWRLAGRLLVRGEQGQAGRCATILRSPREERLTSEGLAGQLGAWPVKAIIEPRGTGETGYEDQLQWHLRRAAAWCGMTLASMRVYDALSGLQALRTMPEVSPDDITLVARGEMCAVALYAALLDGRTAGLILVDPPATQDAPSQKDGKGPAIEMLNCLRYTDLPYVASLLWPAKVTIVGECPETYKWARKLYERLGAPGGFAAVAAMGEV
jgi:dienelactone hydrolase